jgi:hypothetical protein
MFTVYAEKDIFENIVVFNDQAPHWFNIFCNHSEVCLNMTDEELASEELQGTPIFEFIMANGGRSPIALKEFFDSIYEDNKVIADKPRSAFFLNYSKADADAIQSAFGVIVHGNEAIEDNTLKGSFFKDLPKDSVFENQTTKGWQNLVSFSLPPSNAMVITDDYLFSNEENGHIVGKSNVIQLVNAFLPANLSIPYHLTILSNDNPEVGKPPKSKEWCERLAGELKAAIVALRPYPIVFEIVFTQTLHKRKLILNYINATCDKGFAVFRVSDGKTVRSDNDFRCDRLFARVEPQEGDTDYMAAESILLQLKSKCQSVRQFIANSGATVNNRILGDCNADKSLKNRLINDV